VEAREVFKQAIANGWANKNPALEVPRPPIKVKRQRLTIETFLAMCQHAAQARVPWVLPMLYLALLTGQRRGDLHKMRFDDIVEDGKNGAMLRIDQQNKAGKDEGAKIEIPLSLRLRVVDDKTGKLQIDMSVGDAVEMCRQCTKLGDTLIRKRNGQALGRPEMLTYRFEDCINAIGSWPKGMRPSLHEVRSLSSRLYKAQGIDTQTLLGHKHQSATDVYNDDRGLSEGQYKRVKVFRHARSRKLPKAVGLHMSCPSTPDRQLLVAAK
jgi:integrase